MIQLTLSKARQTRVLFLAIHLAGCHSGTASSEPSGAMHWEGEAVLYHANEDDGLACSEVLPLFPRHREAMAEFLELETARLNSSVDYYKFRDFEELKL